MEVLIGGYTSTTALNLGSCPRTTATCVLHSSSTLQTPLQVQEDWGEEELQQRGEQTTLQLLPTVGVVEVQVMLVFWLEWRAGQELKTNMSRG